MLGGRAKSWYAAEKGVFSDRPYVCLEENFWDSRSRTTTTRFYVIEAETGQIAEGWPQPIFGLTVDVLPIVGKGVPTNPILADLDYDGTLEIAFDTISSVGALFNHDGTQYRVPNGKLEDNGKLNNREFGPRSDSGDSPVYILMGNGGMGYVDREGGIDLIGFAQCSVPPAQLRQHLDGLVALPV